MGRQLPINGPAVTTAALSRDGPSRRNDAEKVSWILFDPTNGAFVRQIPAANAPTSAGLISSVAFASDSKRLFTSMRFAPAQAWDIEGNRIAELPNAASGQAVQIGELNLVVLAATGNRVVTASQGSGDAVLWDGKSLTMLVSKHFPDSGVVRILFAPNGDTWAVVGRDGLSRLYSSNDGAAQGVMGTAGSSVTDMTFLGESNGLAMLIDAHVDVWGRTITKLRYQLPVKDVNAISASRNGRLLVTADGDGSARLWDSQTGALVQQLRLDLSVVDQTASDLGPPIDLNSYREGGRAVLGLAEAIFSYDDAFLIGLHTRGKLCVWATDTWREVLCTDAPRGRRLHLAASPTSIRIALWSDELISDRLTIMEFPLEERSPRQLREVISQLREDPTDPQ